jgi:hypothetical protein
VVPEATLLLLELLDARLDLLVIHG